jgi:hypothetical protein
VRVRAPLIPEVAFVEFPPRCQFMVFGMSTEEGVFVQYEDIASCLEYTVSCAQSGQTTTDYPNVRIVRSRNIPIMTFAMTFEMRKNEKGEDKWTMSLFYYGAWRERKDRMEKVEAHADDGLTCEFPASNSSLARPKDEIIWGIKQQE